MSSYRDTAESLRAYRDRLSNELEEARHAAKAAVERAAKVRSLEQELAETQMLLRKVEGDGRRSLPIMLEDVRIAAPCDASWDAMVGDDRVRFCAKCEKNVYNLSALPRAEAEALLAAREGRMCVRLYKRADDTVLTADCPVGTKRRRRRRMAAAALAAVGSGVMAAMAFGARTHVVQGARAPIAMGSVATPVQGEPVMGDIEPEPRPQEVDPAPTTTSEPPRIIMGAMPPPKQPPRKR